MLFMSILTSQYVQYRVLNLIPLTTGGLDSFGFKEVEVHPVGPVETGFDTVPTILYLVFSGLDAVVNFLSNQDKGFFNIQTSFC